MFNRCGLILATFLGASLSGLCCAQSDFQSSWTGSTTTKIKPERRHKFEGDLKQLMGAYKKAGTPWFLTFENFAGDTTEYTMVVPVENFGDLDRPAAPSRVLGIKGWQHLSRNMAQCYTGQTNTYSMVRTELEIDRKNMPIETYWVETSTLVAPGKAGEYLNWLQNEYLPALEKAGVSHFQVTQPIFGAVAGEIVTLRMLKTLAEIDGGPILNKALDEATARSVNAKLVPLVRSSETRIVRLRFDLSYSSGK